ncbi:hypothetical protein SAY87_010591 [Trapa incisa]|uniref:NAC domain-containing protein n=1 Tax=Trapa incisa TaxID=236973 RepID=A0AAN7JHQ7_9MYRT|nr:hypothetical protein SAY87_010591 [Trapa incisa]
MGLKDIRAALPPGFGFYPRDDELVCHYLYKKIADQTVPCGTLVEIDLHTCEPWHLPDVAKLNANEWYFFSFHDRKYATGFRTNRATISGYWKATGKDRTVHEPTTREIVGMRKTLVFYRNRAPNGIKTEWIMHEFRVGTPHMLPKEDWVLCRVFHRSKDLSDDINGSNLELSHPFMSEPAAFSPRPSNNFVRMPNGYNFTDLNPDIFQCTSTSTFYQDNPNNNNYSNDTSTSVFHHLHQQLAASSGYTDSNGLHDTSGFFWG